jgi:hypothetical protein
VPPVFAHVLPLTGSDFRTRLQPAAVAAVFIGVPRTQSMVPTPWLPPLVWRRPKTRVLASLFAGRTLAGTAPMLGITRPRTKTHLERIFQKTRVTRQVELMRLWIGADLPGGIEHVKCFGPLSPGCPPGEGYRKKSIRGWACGCLAFPWRW